MDLVVGIGVSAETVTLAYDPASDAPASLAALPGTYKGSSGHDSDPFSATSTIDATGKLVVNGGCTLTGRLSPHGAIGIFDVSLVNACLAAGSPPQSGILVYDPAHATITMLAPLFGTDIVFAFGTRQ